MIPPTSIDGTDITGATIDGTDVQEITVDGDVVFSAATIIDDFESGNINNYGGDTGNFSVSSTNVISGSNSLEGVNIGSTNYIHSTSGLANYPSAGDKFSFKFKVDGSVDSISGIVFGVQNTVTNNYVVHYSMQAGFGGFFSIRKNASTSSRGSILQRNDFGTPNNNVHRVEINWGTNGLIDCDVFDDDSNNLLGSVSATDTDYTSGGIGWFTDDSSGGVSDPSAVVFDDAKII